MLNLTVLECFIHFDNDDISPPFPIASHFSRTILIQKVINIWSLGNSDPLIFFSIYKSIKKRKWLSVVSKSWNTMIKAHLFSLYVGK